MPLPSTQTRDTIRLRLTRRSHRTSSLIRHRPTLTLTLTLTPIINPHPNPNPHTTKHRVVKHPLRASGVVGVDVHRASEAFTFSSCRAIRIRIRIRAGRERERAGG